MRGVHIKTVLNEALTEWHKPPDEVLKLFGELHYGHKEYVFERILDSMFKHMNDDWETGEVCYTASESNTCPIISHISHLAKERANDN